MKITVVGSGYVGLVTGACLAEVGNKVLCLDIDQDKVRKLMQGVVPFFEPGLGDLIKKNMKTGKLRFTTDVRESVDFGEIQFIAVGTPPDEDGSADLTYVLRAARNIARHMNGYKVIVNKSTVPVGTAELVRQEVLQALDTDRKTVEFDIVSNPEFLREGSAVNDFMYPDRIVIGADSDRAFEKMRKVYLSFQVKRDLIMRMKIPSAELTKYIANLTLATKISLMNQASELAEEVGANIDEVRKGIGSDPRIGSNFLYAGVGYGGSCFPKDVKAVVRMGEQYGVDFSIARAVNDANEKQKQRFLDKILGHYGSVEGLTFALWGLAFKPGTDDMREAPSKTVIEGLLRSGAKVVAYDPEAMDEARKTLGNIEGLTYCEGSMDVLDGVDGLVIVTEWKEFRAPDWDEMKTRMKRHVIFDGRNMYRCEIPREEGFTYFSIGRS